MTLSPTQREAVIAWMYQELQTRDPIEVADESEGRFSLSPGQAAHCVNLALEAFEVMGDE